MFTCKHGHKRSFITMAIAVLLLCMPLSQAEAPTQRVSDLDQYVTDLYDSMCAQYGDQGNWTLEQRAAYDQMIIAAGYSPEEMQHISGLPGSSDIPWHAALSRSVDSLAGAYGLTAADYDQFTAHLSFNVADTNHPVWQVDLQPTNPDRLTELGVYTAYINARTGEVDKLTSIEDSNG